MQEIKKIIYSGIDSEIDPRTRLMKIMQGFLKNNIILPYPLTWLLKKWSEDLGGTPMDIFNFKVIYLF